MVAPAVAASLIGVGGGLLSGGKGKKGGNSGSKGVDRAAQLQSEIASDLYGSTSPLRGLLFGAPAVPANPGAAVAADRIRGILESGMIEGATPDGTGIPPLVPINDDQRMLYTNQLARLEGEIGGTPAQPGQLTSFLGEGTLPQALQFPFASSRDALENQFGVAREATISRTGARGGQLVDALGDLEQGRARAVGQLPLLELPLRESLFNQSLQIASGSPVAASSVAGASGDLFSRISAQAAQEQQAFGESMGSASAIAAKAAMKGGGGGGRGAFSGSGINPYTGQLLMGSSGLLGGGV